MRRLCAWCKKELTPREDMGTEREITHGICCRCARNFADTTAKNKDLLDLINEPVLLVDSRCVVRMVNEQALELLDKDLDAVTDKLGGEVLGCVYAGYQEGCGRTEHCKTCAVRNVLKDTLFHGRSYRNVPAFQKIRTPNGERIMRFFISTERVGREILLRIDDIADNITV